MNGSPALSFGKFEMQKTLKGLGIAVAGTILAYIAKELIPMLQETSYALLIPLASAGINTVQLWLLNNAGSDVVEQ